MDTGREEMMIAIVDDDWRVVETLRLPIDDQGYCVEAASNGVEAYRLIKSRDCRFLLLDLVMPKLDGMELLDLMQREGIGIPTIVMSGNEDPDLARLHRFPFVAKFMAKPVDVQELMATLEEYMRRSAAVLVHTPRHDIRGRVVLSEQSSLADLLAGGPPFVELIDATLTDVGSGSVTNAARVYIRGEHMACVVSCADTGAGGPGDLGGRPDGGD